MVVRVVVVLDVVNSNAKVDIDMVSSVLVNFVVSAFGVEEIVGEAVVAKVLFAFDVSYWFGLVWFGFEDE